MCLSNTGDAVNGRNNAGETEIDACGLDCGLAGLNLSLGSGNGRVGGLYLGLVCKVGLSCIVKILLADGISLSYFAA